LACRSMDMQCWKCGTQIKNLLLPFSRYEECSTCKADLHVCLACRHDDAALSSGCREDRAEFVLDRDKANFCDYFKPNPRPYREQENQEARRARSKLAELFGEAGHEDEVPRQKSAQSEADEALAQLKRLFGDD